MLGSELLTLCQEVILKLAIALSHGIQLVLQRLKLLVDIFITLFELILFTFCSFDTLLKAVNSLFNFSNLVS